jgi:CheY-like chemotaxis protein
LQQSGIKLLLVEDEPTNMAILSAYLRRAGYLVEEAVDGAAAWDKLKQGHDFTAIVTDRRMPNLDGLELFFRMQADDALHIIPVIMQTGANSPEEVAEGIEAGVYYYLTKPYQEEVLLSVVASAVRTRQQSDLFDQRAARQQDALQQTFTEGKFLVRSIDNAQNIAVLLGGLFDRSEAAATGLYELVLNGLEHGNLGIGFDLKAELLAAGSWEAEIERRLVLPENAKKAVTVSIKRDAAVLEVDISDEGAGFNWRPFMLIEPSRATRSNGRGIAKANLLGFDSVSYRGNGNAVTVRGPALV